MNVCLSETAWPPSVVMRYGRFIPRGTTQGSSTMCTARTIMDYSNRLNTVETMTRTENMLKTKEYTRTYILVTHKTAIKGFSIGSGAWYWTHYVYTSTTYMWPVTTKLL